MIEKRIDISDGKIFLKKLKLNRRNNKIGSSQEPYREGMTSIEELRRKIDEIDSKLLELLSERVELARRIGALKRKLGASIVDKAREDEVVSRGLKLAEKLGIDLELAGIMLRTIIGICRKVQTPMKVSFLGPRGSFSEEAALKAFLDLGAELKPMPSILEIFRSVEVGDADYGVVPVENSIEGGVKETLDLLSRTSLKVCGEVQVRISLNLIARPGMKLQDIKLVLSHPHALAQAREFLNRVLKNARVESCPSTAEAVRRAVELKNAAAIASKTAASIYGGSILVSDIQDVKDDYTRFFIIGRKRLERGRGSKTSIIFRLPHKPGSLYEALSIFASRKINLTRIESRPVKDRPWEYLFHVDFEGDCEGEERCAEALRELEGKTFFLKILGSYGVIE
ncbi:MAG: prephenate dehydratase [Thaumarchaeota archaeon]|nr:MAG: prephenate dehydratase [Nitrososphaerota archaeon]